MAQYTIDNVQAPIDFECGSDILKRTLQNAKNLLMTRMGEVPFDRYRGFDMTLYELPLPMLRQELLPELDRLMTYEPDVEVVSASAALNNEGETVITVVLEIEVEE